MRNEWWRHGGRAACAGALPGRLLVAAKNVSSAFLAAAAVVSCMCMESEVAMDNA
jgi:hypothetical protein